MGNNKNETNRSRRGFLTGFFKADKEKIKMLTADGRLVEIDKEVLNAAAGRKVTNKEILQWMKNPSKNERDL